MGRLIRFVTRAFFILSGIILVRVFVFERQQMYNLWKESKNSVFKLNIKPTPTILSPLNPEEEPLKVKKVLDKQRMLADTLNSFVPFLIFLSLPLLWVTVSQGTYRFINPFFQNKLPETYDHLIPMVCSIGLYGLLLYKSIYNKKVVPFVLSIRYSVLFTCWNAIYHFFPHYHQGTPKVTWAVYTSSSYRTEAVIKLWNYTQSYRHLNMLIIAFAGLLFIRFSYPLYKKGTSLVIERPLFR